MQPEPAETLYITLILCGFTFMGPLMRGDEHQSKTDISSEKNRDRKHGCCLCRWNGHVGGCICECTMLAAMCGMQWVGREELLSWDNRHQDPLKGRNVFIAFLLSVPPESGLWALRLFMIGGEECLQVIRWFFLLLFT